MPILQKKYVSVNMQSNKEKKKVMDTTEGKLTKRKSASVTEVDLETPEQSIDDVEKKRTESTQMPNAEKQVEQKQLSSRQ